jgi:hypothetical protein
MEKERAQHIYLQRSTSARVNELRRQMATEVAQMIRRESAGRQTYDTELHLRVKRALVPIFQRYYGAYRGDENGLFFRAIITSTRDAYRLAFRESVKTVRRHVSRTAMKRIERETERGRQDAGRRVPERLRF